MQNILILFKQIERRDRCKVPVMVYQSLGLVFGGLTISPLYVYKSTFSGSLQHYQTEDVVFGAFSMIFWTLTLLSLIKYVVFVLSADDNGEGKDLILLGYDAITFYFILLFVNSYDYIVVL